MDLSSVGSGGDGSVPRRWVELLNLIQDRRRDSLHRIVTCACRGDSGWVSAVSELVVADRAWRETPFSGKRIGSGWGWDGLLVPSEDGIPRRWSD
jgi:hypothetical protein